MLGVRHQAHDVAGLVEHAGDVRDGAVRILLVAEQQLSARVEFLDELGRPVPRAFAVLDRDHESLSRPAPRRECGVAPLDAHRDVAADEGERRVRPQHAR